MDTKDMLKISLYLIILWNVLWCIGLMNVNILTEIDDMYMPHHGPIAKEREDFYDRFADISDELNMIIYHGENNRAGLYQHALDIHNALEEIELTWKGVSYKYNTPSAALVTQSFGQPLRYSKMDCFQEGGLDFHTLIPPVFNTLITAASGIATLVAPLDTNPSSLTGAWLNPYTWCLWADLFKLLQPTVFGTTLTIFGDCKKFLNPDPESTFPVLQAAYDWVNFMLFDVGFATQAAISPCAVHASMLAGTGVMSPNYDDCTNSRSTYLAMTVAQRNAAVNGGISTRPAFWNLNDRVVTDEEVTTILASQCYMWDGGPNGATNALPLISNGVTIRKNGLLTIYFTKGKKDFCKDLSSSEEWKCHKKLWAFGDDFGAAISVHDSNGFAAYSAESDGYKSYRSTTLIVTLWLSVIIIYVVIVGFARGKPLLMSLGVVMLVLAMFASVGMGSAFGLSLTPPMVTVFPLLVMGIGVDDMFILTFDCANSRENIPSITTTSIINILVGCLGYSNQVPYVAYFSLYFGIGAFMLYLTNVFGIHSLCVLLGEEGEGDIAQRARIDSDSQGPLLKDRLRADKEDPPKFVFWSVVISAVVVTIVMISVPFQNIEQDFGLHMLYKKESDAWDFFKAFQKAGVLQTVTLITKETDFAHRQADWPVFIQQIAAIKFSETIPFTWMELFWMWGNPITDTADAMYNTRCSLTDANSAGRCGPNLVDVPRLTAGEVVPTFVGASACIVLPEAYWICDGNVGGCNFGDNTGATTTNARYHPDLFDLCVNKWVDSDDLWVSAQVGFQCEDAGGTHVPCSSFLARQGLRNLKGGRVNASKTTLYLTNIEVMITDWIHYILKYREIREKSPFDTYLYGSYHNVLSSFINIWDDMYQTYGISISVSFVVIAASIIVHNSENLNSSTISTALCTAAFTCVIMTMAFFCTVSMLSVFDIPLMPPTLVIVLLTLGIGVEVMGHVSQEYVKTPGDRTWKARSAVSNLIYPLGNGIFTTIVATCGFFMIKWYFLSDVIGSIVLVSLFVTLWMGLLVLPAALYVAGPPYFEDGDEGEPEMARYGEKRTLGGRASAPARYSDKEGEYAENGDKSNQNGLRRRNSAFKSTDDNSVEMQFDKEEPFTGKKSE